MSQRLIRILLFVRFGLYIAVMIWLALDVLYFHGPFRRALENLRGLSNPTAAQPDTTEALPVEKPIGQVKGQPVTRAELELVMREQLYRTGRLSLKDAPRGEEREKLRREAMETLLDQRLLVAAAEEVETDPKKVEERTAIFRRQFADDEEFTVWFQRTNQSVPALEDFFEREEAAAAWLDQELARRVLAPTEAEVAAYYAEHPAEWNRPAQLLVRHLFLSGHDAAKPDRAAEIQAFHQQIQAGEATVADLAAEHSDDASGKAFGGELPWFSAGRMPADFYEKAAALSVGEVSAPFHTKLGWHIVEKMDAEPARAVPQAEVADEIKARLTQGRREEALTALRKELRASIPWAWEP